MDQPITTRIPPTANSQAEVAEWLDCSVQTIKQWTMKAGFPKAKPYDLQAIARWLFKQRDDQGNEKLKAARLQKEQQLARRHQMMNDKAAGKLVPLEDIQEKLSRLGTTLSAQLLGMVQRVSLLIHGRTVPEIEAELNKHISSFLNDFVV